MKSFLTMLSAMLMTFAVIGCGGGDTATDEAAPLPDVDPATMSTPMMGEGEEEKPADGEEEKPAAEEKAAE